MTPLHKFGKLAGLLLPVLAASVLAACSGATAGGKPGVTNLTFVTDFGLYGRQSFAFSAQQQGFYSQQGIDVTFQPGQGSADAIKQVAVGRAQFGFADVGTLVQSLGQRNLPVKLLGVVYQSPAQGIFALASSGITTPASLSGKTIAAPPGSAVEAMFPAWAKSVHLNPDSVQWVNVSSSAIPQLLASHKVNAVEQFVVGKPLLEEATKNSALTEFSYQNLGFYGNGIIVNANYLASHPDVARKFMKATVEGMQWAFAHPAQAAADTQSENSTTNTAEAAEETRLVAQLAMTPATKAHGLGYVDPAKLQHTINIVASAFRLVRTPTVSEIYAPGFLPTGG